MQKPNIRIDTPKCVSCMACQLICSLTYTGSFNPERACIVINPPDEIRYTDECRESCTLCTGYCEPGAIVRVKKVTKKV